MVTVLADSFVQRVGGGVQPDRDRGNDVGEEADKFGVSAFGGFFAGFPVGDVAVEVSAEVAGFAFVEQVEGVHDLRVTGPSLSWPAAVRAVCVDVWAGLPPAQREFLAAFIVVGCLFFMILGSVLR